MVQHARMSTAEARDVVERLHEGTQQNSPYHPAPPDWIAELHQVIEAIAPLPRRSRYRMDRLAGIDMAYLHRRVVQVLEDFDHLVAENPRLHAKPHQADPGGQMTARDTRTTRSKGGRGCLTLRRSTSW